MNRFLRFGSRLSSGPVSAFVVFGGLGVALAAVVGCFLAAARGESLFLPLTLVGVGVVVILGFGQLTRRVLRVQGLTFYQHALAFLMVSAGLLVLAGRPLLVGLDLAACMMAVFQGVGRLGCLSVGCCHGRPHPRGVRYPADATRAGLRPHLVGVPLFPVQPLEGLLLLGIAGVCAVSIARGDAPGAALASWGVLYPAARFLLEEFRGDAHRPYLGGLSEAQWTSLLVAGGVLALETGGALPPVLWHPVVVACVGVIALVWITPQRRGRRLLAAEHVDQLARLAQAVHTAPDSGFRGPVRTGEDLLLSWESSQAAGDVEVVAFSSAAEPLQPSPARRLAETLRLLFHLGESRLLEGNDGMYFLVSPHLEPSPAPRTVGRTHGV